MSAMDTESDVEIFQQLDWEPDVPCSVTDCETSATWMLVCGACGVGRETVCEPHHQVFAAQDEWSQITFDQTCKHHPFLVECAWEPIK